MSFSYGGLLYERSFLGKYFTHKHKFVDREHGREDSIKFIPGKLMPLLWSLTRIWMWKTVWGRYGSIKTRSSEVTPGTQLLRSAMLTPSAPFPGTWPGP